MTAADKLRELLATRPEAPSAEELVRWWETSGELVTELLEERAETTRARNDERDRLLGSLRREQDARAQLRVQLDQMKAARGETARG